jgi:hypothetical protein
MQLLSTWSYCNVSQFNCSNNQSHIITKYTLRGWVLLSKLFLSAKFYAITMNIFIFLIATMQLICSIFAYCFSKSIQRMMKQISSHFEKLFLFSFFFKHRSHNELFSLLTESNSDQPFMSMHFGAANCSSIDRSTSIFSSSLYL